MYVKFNDTNAGRQEMRSDLTAQQHNWVPIRKHQALFGLRKNKPQPSVQKRQFPLTLSWEYTVHKVKDLSLPETVVRFDIEREKCFNQEQLYVALSRISSMNKMYLIGSYNKATLKVNDQQKKNMRD